MGTDPRARVLSDLPAAFGSGGASPYDHAIRGGGGVLQLAASDASAGAHRIAPVDVGRFLDQADASDRRVVQGLRGPVLDVGCGPGRMVRAAISAGHLALGIDVSDAAIVHARDGGLPVLRRSVFQRLPRESGWGATLLLDGNVGIGGDPAVLLARCRALLRPGGRLVVEAHHDPLRDRAYEAVLSDAQGRRSLPFPWAETGVVALRRLARRARLTPVAEWQDGGRTFAAYARPRSDS